MGDIYKNVVQSRSGGTGVCRRISSGASISGFLYVELVVLVLMRTAVVQLLKVA